MNTEPTRKGRRLSESVAAEGRNGGTTEGGGDRPPVVPTFRLGSMSLPVVLVILTCLGVGLGCSSRFDPSIYPTPEELFEASFAEFQEGDCDRAEVGLRRLAFELPARDPRRAEVRFYLAECSFRRKEYLTASRDYRRVADENATDSLAPHALLRSGDAYAKLWRRPELDDTYGNSALGTYQELLRRYPNSPAAAEGRERILELNEWFAKKAYKAGIYYYRLKAFDSAIIYFKSVVADYPATSFAPQSLVKLVEAYDRIGYEEDREDMCQQIRRFYPDALTEAEPCLSDTAAVASRR
jgi:outer membrane protein assembly factor BamD